MKKILMILLLACLSLSCGTSAVVQEARKTMNGDWVLSSISFPGNEEDLEVSLFNDVPVECLENSTWNFVSNNNTGSYNPAGVSCSENPSFFIWSIEESDPTTGRYDLMFKPTDAEYTSTTGNQGYRIQLTNLSGTQMVWQQTIRFEGAPFTIQMNFNKQ